MNPKFKAVIGMAAIVLATQAAAQITFYEIDGFRGQVFSTDKAVPDMERRRYNDRAMSAVVERGRWEVCEHGNYGGKCVVLRRGSYETLADIGLAKSISSVRPVTREMAGVVEIPAPLPAPTYEYRQRPNERLYEAPVTSARAVVGPPQQRCWVERQQVVADSGSPNVGGAVLGAIIGGVLGHQIGSGRGNDAATVGGAVVGGAIGSQAGRGGPVVSEQDVQRCETAPSGPPQYWDVTYQFRGVEHRVQMAAPPGQTITVNRDGLPRG